MEEKELTQYFLDHPEQYSLVNDSELIKFLNALLEQALTEDEIFFTFKEKAKSMFHEALDMQFIEKIMVAGSKRYFVSDSGKQFLKECEKLRKSFEIFD